VPENYGLGLTWQAGRDWGLGADVQTIRYGRVAAEGQVLTLERLAQFPIITYESGYTGRSHIDGAFRAAGLTLNLVLVAMDAEVIKTYVELGLGVGIVAASAYDEERDKQLHPIDGGHLFADNMTRLTVRNDAYLRDYVYAFISTFAAPLKRTAVSEARLGLLAA